MRRKKTPAKSRKPANNPRAERGRERAGFRPLSRTTEGFDMAKKQKLNSTTQIEMSDGTALPLTITWGLLLKISAISKPLYKKFSRLVTGGVGDDVLGMLSIVYCGYLCAYLDENGTTAGCLTEEEFAAVAPNDINAITTAATELIAPKAARDSKTRSSDVQSS